MSFPFYIARRYLFSKKSTNAINVISGISVVGVAIATMALVVTLSVFNGFHDMVASLFTQLDPQIKVTPVKGKTVAADNPVLTKIRQLPQVDVVTEVMEDQALAVYGDRQAMIKLKGVEDNYDKLTHIREVLEGDGDFELHAADMNYGILGMGVAYQLGTGYSYDHPLKIYAPRREGQLNMANLQEGFVEDELYSPGVLFSIKQGKYPGSDFDKVKAEMQEIAGEEFEVKDRFEQQDSTFRIMKIEKLMAYIFLTFILMIACFNIIGSLSMLIIDKKNDVVTLHNLGASDKQIIRIFLFEGRMISVIGAVIGIAIGLLLCWLQQEYGIVRLGKSEGAFIVDAYPVSVHPWDIVIIFLTVITTGFLCVWYPVRYFAKRLLAFGS